MTELEYAQALAKRMAKKFYPNNSRWQVGDDIFLVIDQIDNMVTGLERRSEK